MTRLEEYYQSPILRGGHAAGDGRCAMEWAAYLAAEPHSDAPKCVSPTITRFAIGLNDSIPDDAVRSQLLRDVIPRTLDTAGADESELERLIWDWMLRTWLPAWLDLVPSLRHHARALRERAEEALPEACSAAAAVKTAAAAAVWSAAWTAARAAAWGAAWAVVWSDAWDAAWDAVKTAAPDAARNALQPTVERLQESAAALLLRLCEAAHLTQNR